METRRAGLLILAAALVFPGAKKAPAVKRHLSARKDFSLVLPAGYKNEPGDPRYVIRWVDTHSGAAVAMLLIAEKMAQKWYEGNAYKAAKKIHAGLKEKDLVITKVYKKTLPNGMKYYFFTYYKKGTKGPVQELRGFINIGTDLYRADGQVARKAYGLENVYKVLGSIEPVKKPKRRKRAIDPRKKPGLIQTEEEQSQGVPLY